MGKTSVWLTPEEHEWIKAMRRLRVCAEKKDYETEGDANRAARIQMDTHKILLTTYRCPECAAWHLTSRLPK